MKYFSEQNIWKYWLEIYFSLSVSFHLFLFLFCQGGLYILGHVQQDVFNAHVRILVASLFEEVFECFDSGREICKKYRAHQSILFFAVESQTWPLLIDRDSNQSLTQTCLLLLDRDSNQSLCSNSRHVWVSQLFPLYEGTRVAYQTTKKKRHWPIRARDFKARVIIWPFLSLRSHRDSTRRGLRCGTRVGLLFGALTEMPSHRY